MSPRPSEFQLSPTRNHANVAVRGLCVVHIGLRQNKPIFATTTPVLKVTSIRYSIPTALRRSRISAGLLMYRLREGLLEVFIAHPGGPWFPTRDHGIWTIPKGEIESGEEPLVAAIREFKEEVGLIASGPYIELGSIKQRGGKTVCAWAFQGSWQEGDGIQSNHVEIEWPPGSGSWRSWPEIDRAGFFDEEGAKQRLKIAQHPFIDRLIIALETAEVI